MPPKKSNNNSKRNNNSMKGSGIMNSLRSMKNSFNQKVNHVISKFKKGGYK